MVMKLYNFLILLVSTLTIFLIFCIMKEDNGLFQIKNSFGHYILQVCSKDLAVAWLAETFILKNIKYTVR